MLDEIFHWHKERKSFTLLQGVVLCGSLKFWANTSTWTRFIYHQLSSTVNTCLHNCSKITKRKQEIEKLVSDLVNINNLDDHALKEKFLQRNIGKEIYRCQREAFINTSMRKELNTM